MQRIGTLSQSLATHTLQPMHSRMSCSRPSSIQHEGRLHDRASYRYYWELLERAHVTGMEIGSAARNRFFA